jgi:mono/diheme cytochrome c family protein
MLSYNCAARVSGKVTHNWGDNDVTRLHMAWACLIGIGFLIVGTGCKKSTPSSAVATVMPSPSARPIFDQNCAKCHTLPGSAPSADGKGGRGKGPDLTRVGADSTHTVDWITEHIRNPKTHKPDSRMPSFDGKLTPADIRALAEWLAAMKG